MNYQVLALAAVLGYLLGSIPFGLLLTRAAGLGDVRSIGSGNIGATNVLRTGNKALAAATLVFDVLKGTAAVLAARWLWGEEAAMVAGIFAFLGHVFPVWLGFKGGKGVATFIGVLVALNWLVGLIFCAVWLVIAFAQKYSSLAAITAAVTSPIFAYVVTDSLPFSATAALLAVILILRHWQNIRRLLAGTEPKIDFGSRKA
jgi:acyl phosphate:glycerol-3-phosphate acyltransferase